VVAAARSRDAAPGVRVRCGRGTVLFTRTRARQGVRGRFEEGIRGSKVTRTFARAAGPRASAHLRVRAMCRGSMLGVISRGRQRANVGVEHVAPHRGRGLGDPQPVPVHRRIAEVVRPSSGFEKRALHRVGRKPSRGKRRVDGSLATSGVPARASARPRAAKGRRMIEERRSSSRERRDSMIPCRAA